MDNINTVGDLVRTLPELLNRYGGYSYVLLSLLLAGGLVLGAVHWRARHAGKDGLPVIYIALAGILVFLSLSGVILRWSGAHTIQSQLAAEAARKKELHRKFIQDYRAAEGERRLLVSDFTVPEGSDESQRRMLIDRMRRQVPLISEILGEGLPEEFSQPMVVALPITDSPWNGVREDNVKSVIHELKAFHILWGIVYPDGKRAKAFLGVPQELVHDLDTVIPLKDVRFEDDPNGEFFREGRYRLLGQVMLAMALDNYWRAEVAPASEQRALLLLACNQLQRARQTLSNWSNDPVLKRNLFSQKVDQLLKLGLERAGLAL